MVVPGGVGRMLSSHGVSSRSLRGTVVIMTPEESTTALGSSGEMLRTYVGLGTDVSGLRVGPVIHPYRRDGGRD